MPRSDSGSDDPISPVVFVLISFPAIVLYLPDCFRMHVSRYKNFLLTQIFVYFAHRMPQKVLNILFIGDIVGKPGLDLVESLLKSYVDKYHIDFCIANGENLVEGKGINEEMANRVFAAGGHVITGGNHLWDNWHAKKLIAANRNVLRPLNYPAENPGNGFIVYDLG